MGQQTFEIWFHCWIKPGKHNTVADTLSRRDATEPSLLALSEITFPIFDQLKAEVAANEETGNLVASMPSMMLHMKDKKYSNDFVWLFHTPKAMQTVQQFLNECMICQRNKIEHLHPAGLLQPLPVPEQIWDL